jgi:hypothetical protein
MIGVGLSIHFLKHNKDLPAKKVSSGETSNVPKKETNIGTENNGIIEFRGIQTKLNFK